MRRMTSRSSVLNDPDQGSYCIQRECCRMSGRLAGVVSRKSEHKVYKEAQA